MYDYDCFSRKLLLVEYRYRYHSEKLFLTRSRR